MVIFTVTTRSTSKCDKNYLKEGLNETNNQFKLKKVSYQDYIYCIFKKGSWNNYINNLFNKYMCVLQQYLYLSFFLLIRWDSLDFWNLLISTPEFSKNLLITCPPFEEMLPVLATVTGYLLAKSEKFIKSPDL